MLPGLARAGVPSVIHEMRPARGTEAHRTDSLAELVCSNSFRSDDPRNNAVGLIHQEMRRMDSLVMASAGANQVPAGGALAVPRHRARPGPGGAPRRRPRRAVVG